MIDRQLSVSPDRGPAAPAGWVSRDVRAVVGAFARDWDGHLRVCQELAAAAVAVASTQTSPDSECTARVLQTLELLRQLERLPRVRAHVA